MEIILVILATYIATYILVKIGYKIDKNKSTYPAPGFIFTIMFIPFLNVFVGFAGICLIVIDYLDDYLDDFNFQEKIFGKK